MLDDAFLGIALVKRTDDDTGAVSVLRLDLKELFANHKHDIPLESGDQVFVFSHQVLNPMQKVVASGEFMKPGVYPLGKNMTLLNLVLAAGGVTDKAFLKQVEVTRYTVEDGRKRVSKHIRVNLENILLGHDETFRLLPYDEVLIRKVSNWNTTARVKVEGEVMFPSVYPIEEGERLFSVLQRAGGFTSKAYLRGAVFTRESIKEIEQQQIDDMISRMETEIAQLESSVATLNDPKLKLDTFKNIDAAKKVVEQLKLTKAQGRLVINLQDMDKLKDSEFNLKLRDGDTLTIPQKPDQVLVLGQVYNNTALLYRRSFKVKDYIRMAGGTARLADESRTYIVRADGQVERVSSWRRTRVYPGDAIVVPEDLEQFNLLDSTLDWSKALMQIGVGLASFKTIGVF